MSATQRLTNVFIAYSLRAMRTVGLLLAFLLSLIATLATASWIAPQRPLSPGEKLASTVGDSPLVAVGRVIAGYDTVVSNGGVPAAFAVVLFEPVRVLRGHAPRRRFRVVFWKSTEGAPGGRPGDRRIWPASYLPSSPMLACFEDISKDRNPNPRFLGEAAAGVSYLAAGDADSPYSIPRLNEWSDSLETLVRREVRNQEPGVLAGSAERIVIARPYPIPDPRSPGSFSRLNWAVLRTLKGPEAKTIDVQTIVPHDLTGAEQAILFLRRVKGVWEPIRFRAGFVAVHDSKVPRWSCSLDEAIRRIEKG